MIKSSKIFIDNLINTFLKEVENIITLLNQTDDIMTKDVIFEQFLHIQIEISVSISLKNAGELV